MATVTYPRHSSIPGTDAATKAKLWAIPIGRLLFSLIFILSGVNHFSSATIGFAASEGIPMANIFVPISGALAIVGGLSVLFGFHARMGAFVLILFLVPVTFSMHAFWAYTDPMEAQNQMGHFLKNVALIGGAILLVFYGSGPVSIDHSLNKHRWKV